MISAAVLASNISFLARIMASIEVPGVAVVPPVGASTVVVSDSAPEERKSLDDVVHLTPAEALSISRGLIPVSRSPIPSKHLSRIFYEASNTWNKSSFAELITCSNQGLVIAKGFLMRMYAFGSGLADISRAEADKLAKEVVDILLLESSERRAKSDPSDPDLMYVDYLLSSCCHKGLGMTRSERLSYEYALSSAKWQYAPAQNYLGYCHEKGVGTDVNIVEALRYYTLAAEQNHAAAQYNLGLYYKNSKSPMKDEKKAFSFFQKSAVQNNIDSQYFLGIFYQDGLGVEKSDSEAVVWFRRSAEQGCLWSQNSLGRCYKLGLGVPKSYEEGAKWYMTAAFADYSISQHNLAFCYKCGEGVEQSDRIALYWFERSANHGDKDAQYHAGMYHFHGANPMDDERLTLPGTHIGKGRKSPSGPIATEEIVMPPPLNPTPGYQMPANHVPINYERAIHYLAQSHANGVSHATFFCALLLLHPETPADRRDLSKGLEILEKIASKPSTESDTVENPSSKLALYILAEMYFHGHGALPHNPTKALEKLQLIIGDSHKACKKIFAVHVKVVESMQSSSQSSGNANVTLAHQAGQQQAMLVNLRSHVGQNSSSLPYHTRLAMAEAYSLLAYIYLQNQQYVSSISNTTGPINVESSSGLHYHANPTFLAKLKALDLCDAAYADQEVDICCLLSVLWKESIATPLLPPTRGVGAGGASSYTSQYYFFHPTGLSRGYKESLGAHEGIHALLLEEMEDGSVEYQNKIADVEVGSEEVKPREGIAQTEEKAEVDLMSNNLMSPSIAEVTAFEDSSSEFFTDSSMLLPPLPPPPPSTTAAISLTLPTSASSTTPPGVMLSSSALSALSTADNNTAAILDDMHSSASVSEAVTPAVPTATNVLGDSARADTNNRRAVPLSSGPAALLSLSAAALATSPTPVAPMRNFVATPMSSAARLLQINNEGAASNTPMTNNTVRSLGRSSSNINNENNARLTYAQVLARALATTRFSQHEINLPELVHKRDPFLCYNLGLCYYYGGGHRHRPKSSSVASRSSARKVAGTSVGADVAMSPKDSSERKSMDTHPPVSAGMDITGARTKTTAFVTAPVVIMINQDKAEAFKYFKYAAEGSVYFDEFDYYYYDGDNLPRPSGIPAVSTSEAKSSASTPKANAPSNGTAVGEGSALAAADIPSMDGSNGKTRNAATVTTVRSERFVRYANVQAYYTVAWCYRYGVGVYKDRSKAFAWFHRAADLQRHNHAQAQYELALCYYRGKGVETNLEEAIFWLQAAALQGLEQAKDMLSKVYNTGLTTSASKSGEGVGQVDQSASAVEEEQVPIVTTAQELLALRAYLDENDHATVRGFFEARNMCSENTALSVDNINKSENDEVLISVGDI